MLVDEPFHEVQACSRVHDDDLDARLPQPVDPALEVAVLSDDHAGDTELAYEAAAVPAGGKRRDHGGLAVAPLPPRPAEGVGFAMDRGVALLDPPVAAASQEALAGREQGAAHRHATLGEPDPGFFDGDRQHALDRSGWVPHESPPQPPSGRLSMRTALAPRIRSFSPAESIGSAITSSTVRSRSYQGKSVPSLTRSGPISRIIRARSSSVGAFGAPSHSMISERSNANPGNARARASVWRQLPPPRWARTTLRPGCCASTPAKARGSANGSPPFADPAWDSTTRPNSSQAPYTGCMRGSFGSNRCATGCSLMPRAPRSAISRRCSTFCLGERAKGSTPTYGVSWGIGSRASTSHRLAARNRPAMLASISAMAAARSSRGSCSSSGSNAMASSRKRSTLRRLTTTPWWNPAVSMAASASSTVPLKRLKVTPSFSPYS